MMRRSGQFQFASGTPRRGFTLIELLVVVAIIALLIAILLPSLGRAKEQAKAVQCLSNLKQMASASFAYADNNNGRFPSAYFTGQVNVNGTVFAARVCWDSIVYNDTSVAPAVNRTVPGLLWQGSGGTVLKIQQCPSFQGNANMAGDFYTGYNYNTTYVGRGDQETPSQDNPDDAAYQSAATPVRVIDLRKPATTALFGDGQYAKGANKFMRAPADSSDAGILVAASVRAAGTQGYRHLGKTNVACGDGHAESWSQRYTNIPALYQSMMIPGVGFLSVDNALYSLE
ncbi:MAG: prepilin-type N-terminal cleavage/methylation domain-containing protein [Phycisphaerae bacterium]